MANLNHTFARNVRKARLERSLSQERLAESCGRHRTYIGNVERGEANVTLEVVEAIALALGIDPVLLLSGGNS